MISFAPLWKTLKRKGITQYELINRHGVSTGTLDALRKNKSVTLNTVQDLCLILDCPISDVVEILPDPQDKPKD
ncbi:MAG: helix-turn-helix transcriptional regulator [Oscillospiraceae bacterium]|nr:helix-turn-helix transcriptional regulator [Oscillospiraceae bacterium]